MRNPEKDYHRKFAVDLFNYTWKLLEKKRKTKEQELVMIHAAHASRFHWEGVGTPVNRAIGEWQISRVYAVLNKPEPSLFHAARCLEICKENDLHDYPLAYAYEALARASHAAGKKKDCAHYIGLGKKAGSRIKKKDDRELFFRDLETVTGYK